MKQIFLLIFILVSLLDAKKILLTKSDLDYINKQHDKSKIVNRLIKYKQLLDKTKDFPIIKKLAYVNAFYNKILPINDSTKYNADDYWATPKEFIIQGKGDCEDYAISKYFALSEIGIPKENLFLAVVKVANATSYHMVLLYFENKKAMPLVLDNLSFKVLDFDKRKRLVPKFIFNEKEAFVLKNKKIYKKARINWKGDNKWEKILTRVYKNKE